MGASEVSDRIQASIEDDGYANVETIIGAIRVDESIFLPSDETETAAREAVNDFLVDDHVLEAGGRYLESLGDRDPTTVKLIPIVPDRIGDQILEYIGGLGAGDQFTVNKVTDRFDDSVTEYMVRTFLLANIGKDEEPEYVVNTTGSDKAADWVPGYPFRKADPDAKTWRFEYRGDDVTAMRSKWRQDHETGTVEYGDVTFMLPDKDGIPGSLQGTVDVDHTQVSLTLKSEQEYTKVQDLFERMPDEASSLQIEISFEK